MELKEAESQLHASLPQHLQVMKNKRLLLWKEILNELRYPDVSIIDETITGFPITGCANSSHVFQGKLKPPTMSKNQLKGIAYGLNVAVIRSLQAAEWKPLDQDAWQETKLKVDKGWLRPCPQVDVRQHHIAKRFAIQQKEKTRMIDDFSICGVNSTFGLMKS